MNKPREEERHRYIVKNEEYALCPMCKKNRIIYCGGYWVCEKPCMVVDLTSEHHIKIRNGYEETE